MADPAYSMRQHLETLSDSVAKAFALQLGKFRSEVDSRILARGRENDQRIARMETDLRAFISRLIERKFADALDDQERERAAKPGKRKNGEARP